MRNNKSSIKNRKKKVNQNNSSNVKSRLSQNGKPKIDLRQLLTKKASSKNVKKNNPNTIDISNAKSSSDVKSRLGLQSKSARLEASKEAKKLFQTAKDKIKPNVKDRKPLKNAVNKPNRNSNLETKNSSTSRDSLNNKNSVKTTLDRRNLDRRNLDRRNSDRFGKQSNWNDREDRSMISKNISSQPIIIPQLIPQQPTVIVQQPPYESSGSKFIRRSPVMTSEIITTMGNSVLVSNLSQKITEDEVAELFGDIGPLVNVQLINSTTALVTYFASQHAAKAVKIYNFRLLDGIAMNCTIVPSTNLPHSSNSAPIYTGSRMYSDSIPIRRANYHLN